MNLSPLDITPANQPDHRSSRGRTAFGLGSLFILAACGGGGGSGGTDPGTGLSNAQRAAAAQATVNTNALCSAAALNSYYWEIGDSSGTLASGSVGPAGVTADTAMNIASASKWPFAAYVYEKYGDVESHRPYLNFTSGYSNFNNAICPSSGTVAECLNGNINSAEAAAKTFHYQGGHMQQLAVNLGLGSLRNATLATELRSSLGTELGLAFVEPLPPGGLRTTARQYGAFLRKLLVGSSTPLRLGAALGNHAVCTQPSATCNASSETAAAIPENFHYALGHWVEDDPSTMSSANFAYSSAGKFGFYPWVDVERKLYGVIAREDNTLTTGEGYSSLRCGRLVRLAWKTGVAQ